VGTGTSTGFLGCWREVRASGRKWLGYAKSHGAAAIEPLPSTPRFSGVWAWIGLRGMICVGEGENASPDR
jgi:hypothetical protein